MIPDSEGIWYCDETEETIEVYNLEPVVMLCIWGPEIGYNGGESEVWLDDEWIGHVPVSCHCWQYDWRKIS